MGVMIPSVWVYYIIIFILFIYFFLYLFAFYLLDLYREDKTKVTSIKRNSRKVEDKGGQSFHFFSVTTCFFRKWSEIAGPVGGFFNEFFSYFLYVIKLLYVSHHDS